MIKIGASLLAVFAVACSDPPQGAKSTYVTGKFADVDVRTVIRSIIATHRPNIVVWDDVRGKVSVKLDDVDVHNALQAAVASLGASVTRDEYGVLCIAPTASPYPVPDMSGQPRMREFVDADLHEVVTEIAEFGRIGVIVGPGVEGRITHKIDKNYWLEALHTVAPEGVIVANRDGIVRVVRPPSRPQTAARFILDDADVRKAIGRIAKEAKKTFEVDPRLRGRVMMNLKNVPWRHALTLASQAVNAYVTRNEAGSYLIRCPEGAEDARYARELQGRTFFFITEGPMSLPILAKWVDHHLGRALEFQLPEAQMASSVSCRLRGSLWRALLTVADAYEADVVELDDGRLRLSGR